MADTICRGAPRSKRRSRFMVLWYCIGGRRTAGINLEPTNHFSRNSETAVNYQPVSQAGVVQLLLLETSQTDQTAPSSPCSPRGLSGGGFRTSLPPSPLTYKKYKEGTRSTPTRTYMQYSTSVRREGESEMGCAKAFFLTDRWRWASKALVCPSLSWSFSFFPGRALVSFF